jgi:glycosyltransferase involved in cell wall biosynthesis
VAKASSPYRVLERMPWQRSLIDRLADLREGTIRVGYLYEEAEPGTFRYRCYNMAQAINGSSRKYSASYFFLHDLQSVDNLADFVDVLVLVRVRFDSEVDRLVRRFRLAKKPVLFDLDDHIFDLNSVALLVASLNQGLTRHGRIEKWTGVVGRIRQSVALVDGVLTTTEFLAGQLRNSFDLPVEVVPNFLNDEQWEYSARLRDEVSKPSNEAPVIGYFSGSPSHNRDYQIAEDGLLAVLNEFPDSRLRIAGYLDVPQSLKGFSHRVDRLPFMDFLGLQRAIAEVTLNISPVQHNVFAHSKSELKHFEAAAVATPTIASPAPTFTSVIDHGSNGYLADAAEWPEVFRMALDTSAKDLATLNNTALNHVDANYTANAVAPRIEAALQKLSS